MGNLVVGILKSLVSLFPPLLIRSKTEPYCTYLVKEKRVIFSSWTWFSFLITVSDDLLSITILIIIYRVKLAYGMCPWHGESKCATSHAASQQSQRSRGASDLFPYLLRDSKLSWPTKGQGQVSGDWHLCNLHGHTAQHSTRSCFRARRQVCWPIQSLISYVLWLAKRH